MSLLLLFNQAGVTPPPPPPSAHVRISCAWDNDTIFAPGTNGPFRAVFSRPDGGLLAVPSAASAIVRDIATGLTVPGPAPVVTIEGTVPASQQVVSWDYAGARGAYVMEALATFGADIAGGETVIIFNI